MSYNSFNGPFRITSEARTKEVGRSEATEFTASHSYSYKEGSDVEMTLVFWGARGKTAATILAPGDLIFATGELSFREYKGKTYYNVSVNNFQKVGAAKKRETLEDDAPPVLDDELSTGLPF